MNKKWFIIKTIIAFIVISSIVGAFCLIAWLVHEYDALKWVLLIGIILYASIEIAKEWH